MKKKKTFFSNFYNCFYYRNNNDNHNINDDNDNNNKHKNTQIRDTTANAT